MLIKSYHRWLGIGAAAPLLLIAGVAMAEPDLSTRIMNAAFDRSGFYDGQAQASPAYGNPSLGYQPYAYSGSFNPYGVTAFQPTQQLAYYYYRPYRYYYRPYRYYYRPYYRHYYRPVYYRYNYRYYRPYRYYYRPYGYYRYGSNDYVFPASVSYQLAYGTMR